MIPDFEINVHFDPKLEYLTSNMAFTAKFDGQKSDAQIVNSQNDRQIWGGGVQTE